MYIAVYQIHDKTKRRKHVPVARQFRQELYDAVVGEFHAVVGQEETGN